MRSHAIAPARALEMTCASTNSGARMPLPTVAATLSLNIANATKLKNAAHATAVYGRNTPVETTVAMELAASWNPLRKSNARASPMRSARVVKLKEISIVSQAVARWRPGASGVLEDHAFDDIGHVLAA